MLGGVAIAAPSGQSDEIVGLLRLCADKDLAKRLLEHQATWKKVYEENQALLHKIQKVKDLEAAQSRLATKESRVDEKLSQVDAKVNAVMDGARAQAADIVRQAEEKRQGLAEWQDRLAKETGIIEERAKKVEDQEKLVDKLLGDAEKTNKHAKAERAELKRRRDALINAAKEV